MGFLGPAQDLLGLRGAQPQSGGVLDHLVVLLGDELPANRPGQHVGQALPHAGAVVGTVKPDGTNVLQPGQQPEAEQFGEREPNDGGTVGVDVVGLDLRIGTVPEQALDHRRDLG